MVGTEGGGEARLVGEDGARVGEGDGVIEEGTEAPTAAATSEREGRGESGESKLGRYLKETW